MAKKTKKAKKTRKVKSAGRFGARYGRRTRKTITKIEAKQKAKHACPFCGKKKVVRISAGKWRCRSCKREIAGGAYTLETELGRIAKRIIKTSVPAPELKEEVA